MEKLNLRQLHAVVADAERIRATEGIERGPSYEKAALKAFYIHIRGLKGVAADCAAMSDEVLNEEEKKWVKEVRHAARKLAAPGQSAVSRNIEGPRVKKPSWTQQLIHKAQLRAQETPGKLVRNQIVSRARVRRTDSLTQGDLFKGRTD